MTNHLQATDMFQEQKMKLWVPLVCLYQHRAFLTDLILTSSEKKVITNKLFLLKALS